jgi:hypothetical protein
LRLYPFNEGAPKDLNERYSFIKTFIKAMLLEGIDKNEIIKIIGDFESKKKQMEPMLSKKYKKEEIEKIFNEIKQADPTGDKGDYAFWIGRLLAKSMIRFPEDIDKVKEKLQLYIKVKDKATDVNKDIMVYKTYSELVETLEKYKEKENIPESKREIEKRMINEGQKIIYQDATYTLMQLSNPESCSVLFRDTEWCVKDPRFSKEYLKQADLYYFIKNNKPYALFHLPSKQWYDKYDRPLKTAVMKELYPILKKKVNVIVINLEDNIDII